MSVRVRMGAGESQLENQQIRARLEALGLKVNQDNTIDEASAKSVAGGLEAIQALARDGVLTGDAMTQLRRQTTLIGKLTSQDLAPSKKEDNAWRALAMELNGVAGTFSSMSSTIARTGSIDNSMFHKIGARLDSMDKAFNALDALNPDPAKLARTSPAVLRETAAAGKSLTEAATKLQTQLSMFRSAMLEQLEKAHGPEFRVTATPGGFDVEKRPGLFGRMQIDALAGSLVSALEAMPTYAKIGQALSLPVGSAASFDGVGAKQSAPISRYNGGAQTLLNALGSDPILFPGAVGRAFADRLNGTAREAFWSVMTGAASDLAQKKEVSNAYGQTTFGALSLYETDAKVPRPAFRAALQKAQGLLDAAIAELPPNARTPNDVFNSVLLKTKNSEPDAQVWARAARDLFTASSTSGQVRAGYGVNSA